MSDYSIIFRSRDLPADWLVCPLRSYHDFFAVKIWRNEGLAKGGAILANVITGIVVYPIFGLLALIGMLIKSRGVEDLRAHNREQISVIDGQSSAYDVEECAYTILFRKSKGTHLVQEFKITFANAVAIYDQVKHAIETYNAELRRVYLNSEGRIDKKKQTGEITIRLYSQYP